MILFDDSLTFMENYTLFVKKDHELSLILVRIETSIKKTKFWFQDHSYVPTICYLL